MKVVWTERARQQLQVLHDHIDEDQPLNAVHFIERVDVLSVRSAEQKRPPLPRR